VRVSRFAKYHGLGNDFVILEADAPLDAALARRLCERHRGIGADGVLTLLPPRVAGADRRLHIYNADGSVAEMCGNGLRCVIAYLGRAARVDTDAGLLDGRIEADGRVRVTLGPARLGELLTLEVEGERVEGLVVSMGNPHFVLRPLAPEDVARAAVRLGPPLERAPSFPDRTNVEFIAARADGLEVTVFERGVGFTEACGTGAAAAAVAAEQFGIVRGPRVRTLLPGGPLDVELGEEIAIVAPAVKVFDGTFQGL